MTLRTKPRACPVPGKSLELPGGRGPLHRIGMARAASTPPSAVTVTVTGTDDLDGSPRARRKATGGRASLAAGRYLCGSACLAARAYARLLLGQNSSVM